MKVKHGKGTTKYGPGVDIELEPHEVYRAIMAYLTSRDVYISGPITTFVNGGQITGARVYVDPSGYVVRKGKKISGRGKKQKFEKR